VRRWGGLAAPLGAPIAVVATSIIAYGVMSTPALVLDDQAVLSGRVLSPDTIRDLITAAAEK
jgi:protein-disulfide isomerase